MGLQKMKKKRMTKRRKKRILQLYTRMGVGLMCFILIGLSVMKIFHFGVFSSEAKYRERGVRILIKASPI